MSDLCQLDGGLYIGSYISVCSLEKLPASTVIHDKPTICNHEAGDAERFSMDIVAVLTADVKPLPSEMIRNFVAYRHVAMEDSLAAVLIDEVEDSFAFIEENRKKGISVIVHCNAGISRSAAIATAYLMKKRRISVEDALQLIREVRPVSMPNENFLAQLRLYEEMGYCVDPAHETYRRWKLGLVSSSSGLDGDVLDCVLADSPRLTENHADTFCCRMCRCPLFLTANVLIHPPKIADAETDPGFSKPVAVACTEKELFIEPVVWMKDDIMKTSGKLSCQKCKKKIGTFSWIGERCPCGTFVTPAFHLDKGKVEPRKRMFIKPIV